MDTLLEFIERLLNWLGYEGETVELVIGTLIIVLAIGTIANALYRTAMWAYKEHINYRTAKDLHPYFSKLEVKNATLNFVNTRFQNVPPSQDEEPGRTYIAAAQQELIPLLINKAFDASCDDEKYYIILADSGMGKTTFMINLYLKYKFAFRWPWTNRFNIRLFPLGDPKSLPDIRSIDKEERRNTILLLDAFDEDNKAVEDYQARLQEIIDATWDFRDVVITCRTQFFPDSRSEPHETGKLKFGPRGGSHSFKKLYVSVFSEQDIKQYLRKKFKKLWFFKGKNYFKASSIVLLSPNLMIRPMLLSHIEDLVKKGADYRYSFQIYRTLIDEWLIRESRKPGIQSTYTDCEEYKANLYEFSLELAKVIYLNEDHRERTSGRFGKVNEEGVLLGESSEKKMLLAASEQTSRSLLNRNAVGEYKFSHKSIYEYLLAINVLEDFNFRNQFLFLENLDACKQFFNELRQYDPIYQRKLIHNYQLLAMKAIEEADSSGSASATNDKTELLEKVSASVNLEFVKEATAITVSISLLLIFILEATGVDNSIKYSGILPMKTTVWGLAFLFFLLAIYRLWTRSRKTICDIERDYC